jgi:hypothetical protein
LVLAEGKKREIRRMLSKLGHKVMSLYRVAVGPVSVKGLSAGQCRPLSRHEIDLLRKVASGIAVPFPRFFDEGSSTRPPREPRRARKEGQNRSASTDANPAPDRQPSNRDRTARRTGGPHSKSHRAPSVRERHPARVGDRSPSPPHRAASARGGPPRAPRPASPEPRGAKERPARQRKPELPSQQTSHPAAAENASTSPGSAPKVSRRIIGLEPDSSGGSRPGPIVGRRARRPSPRKRPLPSPTARKKLGRGPRPDRAHDHDAEELPE